MVHSAESGYSRLRQFAPREVQRCATHCRIEERARRGLITVGEGLDEVVGVLMVHAAGVREEVEVAAHAEDGAAQLPVHEAEVLLPEVEELLHLLVRQPALSKRHIG